jgi:hypothetical protein
VLNFRLIPPEADRDVPLDSGARKRAIEAVLSTLKENYVYPETAEE